MNKKTKRISIKRKINEVIELKQIERIVLFCENCHNEQNFRLKEVSIKKSFVEENESINSKNIFFIKDRKKYEKQ